MKKKSITFITVLLSFLVIMGFTQINKAKFYYAYNEKIYLNELDNKLIVRYKQNKGFDKKRISLYSELSGKLIVWKDDSTCVITFSANEKVLFKGKLQTQVDVKSCNPVYAINTGLEMGTTDEFLVKFNENVSLKDIQKLHKKYDVEVVKTTDLYQLIKVPAGSDALEIANSYQESGLARFSQPNFICEMELHQVIPNDPYFANQFALNNTGQVFTDGHSGTIDADIDAPEAWSITQGNSNITIAVLDQGLTSDHPDLPNTRQVRLNGSNFADGDPNNPSPTGNGNHGNACAGTIGAAQNNNQGISGVAPNCKIMPVRIFNSDGSGITPQRLADAITFARQNGAQIISNSWGYNSDNPNLQPVIRDAIIAATTQGRNGLGCIVVFSAGNNIENNGFVHFPSNVNVSGVLTVGASDRYDLKAYYSPLGNPSSSNNQLIDIVAPSHRAYSCQIATETFEGWAIDIPDNAGYNPVHENDCGSLPGIGTILPNAGTGYLSYTGRFGGTSYSCPQVAGVAALVLSINPNLSQQQVFDILTSTADKVGGYSYTNGFCNELGYGRLNACHAISKAVTTIASIVGSTLICSSSSATFSVNNLPSVCTISWACSNNLQKLSSSGNTAVFISTDNGTGWVQPNLISCDGSQYPIPAYHVLVGTQKPGPITIGFDFPPGRITAQVTRIPSATTYKWYLDGVLKYTTPNAKAVFQRLQDDYDHVYYIDVATINACGVSDISHAEVSAPSGYNAFSIYPNPATDNITIAISSPESTDSASLIAATQAARFILTNSYTIRILDNFGSLKASLKRSGETVTIPVSNLRNGIYIVEINDGKKVYRQQLVIKR